MLRHQLFSRTLGLFVWSAYVAWTAVLVWVLDISVLSGLYVYLAVAIVVSYATAARLLDEIDTIPGCEGVLLTFDDFVKGTEDFGSRIQPLMKSRRQVLEVES